MRPIDAIRFITGDTLNGSNQLYAETYTPPQYVASSSGAQVNQDIFSLLGPGVSGASYDDAYTTHDVVLVTTSSTYKKMIEFSCPIGGTLYSSFMLDKGDGF